ncbi:MAG: NTPase family-like protein [Phycisphaerales bacterium]|nr:NTPase family-like protein [Phycisphaerales bacterium]
MEVLFPSGGMTRSIIATRLVIFPVMNDVFLKDTRALPRRRFLDPSARPRRDPDGFHDENQPAFTIEEVLGLEVALVTAPPWTGKSFVARQLEAFLRIQAKKPATHLEFGAFFHLTSFERHHGGLGLVPAWWKQWKELGGPGCWILDAVDEDERLHHGGAQQALDEVEQLEPEQRARLHLLLFARTNEIPRKIVERLQVIYGEWDADLGRGLRRLQLAPFDARGAREFLGNAEEFRRVSSLIRQNRLQSIAGYPSVLDRLRHYVPEAHVTDVRVWRDVLLELIRDKRIDDPLTPDVVTLELQLRAAAWLAVVLTFGDSNEMDDGFGTSGFPGLDRLVPSDHAESRDLNRAARVVLKSTIFRRTTSGYRFAQHHVQEWLTAFGLASFSLTQLRPLMAGDSGAIAEQHTSIAGLLVKTTEHEGVRQWIIRQFGGIPPRSDAAPLQFAEALFALDRLQAISRATPWGLSTWQVQDLSWLDAPGMGTALASRLADDTLAPTERDLIVDVARAIGATEAVAPALDVARNPCAEDRLRVSAAFLVLDLGAPEQQLQLGSYVATWAPATAEQRGMKADVIRWLYHRRRWTFDEAARHAPPADGRTAVLHHQLEEEMALANAREILRQLDVENFLSEHVGTKQGKRHYHAGRLVLRAIGLMAKQAELSEADYELLLPVALSLGRKEWRGMERPELNSVFRRNVSARRKLVTAGFGLPDSVSNGRHAPWRWALLPEDSLWLVDLAERDGLSRPWLWDWVIQLATQGGISPELDAEVRARVMAMNEALWQRHAAARRAADEQMAEYEKEDQAYRSEREANSFALEDLVRATLSSADGSLHEKAVRLSWIALSKPTFRPSNVTGSWDELPKDLRGQVLDLCERALAECEPTKVPAGNSYPAGVMYEPFCFARVLAERADHYTLDAEQVRKWLPACLAFYEDVGAGVLARCAAADPRGTEKAILAEVARRLSAEAGGPYFMQQLPAELWSPSFGSHIARLVADGRGTIDGRSLLLSVLMARSPDLALPLLREWVTASDPDTKPQNARRYAALNLLLGSEPHAAWGTVVAEVQARGTAALLRLTALVDRHPPQMNLAGWSAQLLADLAGLLYDHFPPDQDPAQEPGESRQVTTEDEFRRLRDRVPQLLLSRATPEDRGAVERLAAKYPAVNRWYAHVRGQQAAVELLQQLEPTSFDGSAGRIPVGEVVKLLDDGVYRLIRSADDLQAVLAEEIDAIAEDAKLHLALLYAPRKGRRPKRERKTQPTLQEDALQSYFHCRLSDRLVGRVLGRSTRVLFLNREPQTVKDQRLDIKVEAPTLAGSRATVVIELKWSHHPRVSTSLTEQLGKEYLLSGGVSRGIYLVGWSRPGVWNDRRRSGPSDRMSPAAWEDALSRQASAFSVKHPVAILARVVDLSWPASRITKTGAGVRKDRMKAPPARQKTKAATAKRSNSRAQPMAAPVQRRKRHSGRSVN